MKFALAVVIATALGATALSITSPRVIAAQSGETVDAHVARAKAAAADRYRNLFTFLCASPVARGGAGRAGGPEPAPSTNAAGRGAQGPITPDRSVWHAEPVKVFDNLYFVGQSEYSAWAVTTSEGIVLLDTLFDYSVEDEVAGGLRKLGLDPASIRYAVVTHPHPDHHGGAKFLQERYHTRVLMSSADWDVIDRLSGTKPTRDIIATDGQTLTVGDTTLTLYVTPGHTPGTLSLVFPVRENGRMHTVAYWGGNGLNADRESIRQYIESAQRFAAIARRAGADVMMTNHTDWDGSKVYLPQLESGSHGSTNPYVVGADGIQDYLTVARECATARLLRAN